MTTTYRLVCRRLGRSLAWFEEHDRVLPGRTLAPVDWTVACGTPQQLAGLRCS